MDSRGKRKKVNHHWLFMKIPYAKMTSRIGNESSSGSDFKIIQYLSTNQ